VSILTRSRADADGVAVIDVVIPSPVPLPEASFQAVVLGGAENFTSNAIAPLMHPPESDLDADGLDALTELAAGTDPAIADTDGGGLSDGEELSGGTDPLDPTDDISDGLTVDDLEPGDLVVTEFIKDPLAVGDLNGEWIELKNLLDADVDLAGLEIADRERDTYSVLGPLVIPAGGYVVLGRNADPAINGGVDLAEAYGSALILANGDDEIVLTRPDGVELFDLAYDDGDLWPDDAGLSIQLQPDGDPANPADWCHAVTPYGDGDLGTPGAPNTACLEPVTYADIEPILADSCYGCHGGPSSSGGVNFDTYDELFQTSIDVPSIQLITASDLDASYLYQKVMGTQSEVGGSGSRMPLSGPPLPDDDLTLLADWIEGGAPE
jgi:hypothetical protein